MTKCKIDEYSITTKQINRVCKRSALWIHEGSKIYPAVYFQKPKWISEESFLKIIENIKLNLPKYTELRSKDE